MASERGFDRLIFFTDAVAAIAITLLILPLVDVVPEAAKDSLSVADFLGETRDQILGFLISFIVIAQLWRAHHTVFEHVRTYSSTLIRLNLVWAFTIVLLPLPTAIISQLKSDQVSVGFYIGTMAASSLILSTITSVVRGNAALESQDNPVSGRSALGSYITSALFVLALIVAVAVPAINLWALLLVALAPPANLIAQRFLRRASSS